MSYIRGLKYKPHVNKFDVCKGFQWALLNSTHSNDAIYKGAPCVHMKPVYLLIQVKGFIFEREVVELWNEQ